jgi:phenylalanyl-tRNA synthetase beta chain
MNISLNWLRDYIGINIPVGQLVERLTLAGLEVATFRSYGHPVPEGLKIKQEEPGPIWETDKIVTAHVLEITRHPNADKLKLVKLDYGAAEPKVVVTGAPNIHVGEKGHKVILGLRGSTYFFQESDDKPKEMRTLQPKSMRGIDNDAMVMSAFELGIHDDHEGIILLEASAPVGRPLVEYIGDIVLSVDVLPNMARCLGMIGVAREVAAILGQKITLPKVEFPTGEKVDGAAKVQIVDPKLSARYAATIIKNVTIGPSPAWMQWRLQYSGMRPINNIVDITNFVMMEYGQPLHAFDYDVLVKRAGGKAPTIIVRPARQGEVLVTLDKAERKLSPENLVIADEAGAIALAGVMGGLETEVSASTKNILLESASFDFVSIRKTSRQFNLFSEASTRFSRGIHPEIVQQAAMRAAQLMHLHAGGTVLAGMVDHYPNPTPPQVIDLRSTEIQRILGNEIPEPEVERILTSLEFTLEKKGPGHWKVTTPPLRLDIQAGQADLIEELARIRGYDRLPTRLLADELPHQKGNRSLSLEDRLRDTLANLGLHEVMTYSLTSPELEARLGAITTEYVRLLNPISPERSVMRQRLLPGVLDITNANLEKSEGVAFFEVGFVYLPKAGEKLPDEPRRLAIVMTGRKQPAAWDDPLDREPARVDLFDLKGVIEEMLNDLHVSKVQYQTPKNPAWLHPGRSAEFIVNGASAGMFGELHPKIAGEFKHLAEKSVLVAELDLEVILAAVPERFAYRPISAFPAALRDLAVTLDDNIPAEKALNEIRAAGGEFLRDVRLFDVYKGSSIPEGKKSLAFALTYQALDATLSEKEIEKAHKKIEDRLRHILKGQIRGKD